MATRVWKIKYFNCDKETIVIEKFVGTYDDARTHGANRVYTDGMLWGCVTELWD